MLEKEGTGNSIDPFPIRVAHLQYIGFASLGALVLKVLLDLRVNAIAISVIYLRPQWQINSLLTLNGSLSQ